ncbi:MAG: dihydroorotase [Rhodoferax sp.]|nr:MAG: dihydroorotase [Rhodoferax sp.]
MLKNLLIQGGRVIDPASKFDGVADVAIANGKVLAVGTAPSGFVADETIAAQGCIVAPGLVDLCARLREPGQEHKGMLASELAAAVAGGVTALVCPPDTDPVLDEPGLVEMLRYRARSLNHARVFPLGALTRNLQGEVLTEMQALTEAGCVGFSQAEVTLANTQVLQRALQYASTFGYTVWLRPQDYHLGKGVAASGPFATRMGLAGVPVAAETIALHTIFELMRATKARVHLCRLSSAAGVDLVRQAKAEGLLVTCDVSINSLHLSDVDMGYFDSRTRLTPPLRQTRDRDALRTALADGTIDALVSDHMPVAEDEKALPFAEAEPGATGLELLLPLGLKWASDMGVALPQLLALLTSRPAALVQSTSAQGGPGGLAVGGVADVCVFDPQAPWVVGADTLQSRSHHTPFEGYELLGRVRATVAHGHLAYQAA